jgi:hypothetical protein
MINLTFPFSAKNPREVLISGIVFTERAFNRGKSSQNPRKTAPHSRLH